MDESPLVVDEPPHIMDEPTRDLGGPPYGMWDPPIGPDEPPLGPGGPPPGPGGPPPGPGGGPAAPGGPPAGPPRAARATTIALIAGLFVAIVVTGVLGTVAVLMTREPDLPLGAAPPRRLAAPIHFAPVTGVRAAPCPGAEAVLDEAGTTCYQVAPGVTVTSAVKIETVADKEGTYSVRLVPAPESRQKLADLTKDTLDQQLAVVVDDKVVTAPRVAQPMTEDSLSIAGLTKETADALVYRLLGTAGSVTGTGAPTPSSAGPTSTCPPGTTGGDSAATPPVGPSAGASGGPSTGPSGGPSGGPGTGASPGSGPLGDPATCSPSAGTPTQAPSGAPSASVSQPGSMPLVPPSATHTPGAVSRTSPAGQGGETPRTRSTGASSRQTRTADPRFASCKQAHAANYGPYTKGVHPEYEWYVDGDHDGVACERGDIT
ncbi:excalibur calcium-binding domain-containing protein [Sphaerisporangium perillae]|uniref:excalibur calcium-binding domain-containing protein n=1 Tax=Sphaerisporangium perillae TaxID=2935860 RepID=UPI00200F51AC|nr:excalibur calcium-binding domain-containing protein [Sphaerisporangium perillae]